MLYKGVRGEAAALRGSLRAIEEAKGVRNLREHGGARGGQRFERLHKPAGIADVVGAGCISAFGEGGGNYEGKDRRCYKLY